MLSEQTRKMLAIIVAVAAVALGAKLFPRPEALNVECHVPPSTSERILDLTVEKDGRTVRTISLPLAAGTEFVAPEVKLRPGHYAVRGMTEALSAHTIFDVPGPTPVLMLSASKEVTP